MIGFIAGLQVVESLHLTDLVEDWSRVRSPARAARRLKRGFRQNIVTRLVPKKDAMRVGNVLYVHPETLRAWRQTPQWREAFGVPTANETVNRYVNQPW